MTELWSFPVHTLTVRDKVFADIIDDLRLAISGHNFRLTEQARIGEAIAERDAIEFPALTVLHFCNLSYARQLLEMAPDWVLRMPCRISVRQRDNGQAELQALLLPDNTDNAELNDFAKMINAILLSILEEGAS
ncbi:MAG: DUF302 domain-containing protein [Thiolinea sp.]